MKKIYSLAQLKRDAAAGNLYLEMTERYGEGTIPERLKGARRVVSSNSNSITFQDDKGEKSWLSLANAALTEYSSEGLLIFATGKRKPNEAEQKALDEWKKIEETPEYQKQLEYDLMTDCNACYYREKRFWESKGMDYMFFGDSKRLRYDHNDGMIWDAQIRGELLLAYRRVEQTR